MAGITFTPEELSKTFQTYRKDFIVMPMLAMSKALQHMSVRTGIRYRETVSEMGGNFELGNYKKDKKGTGDVSITGRVLETFFGNCVEPIDPNAIYQSIWGSNVTKGDGLKNVPIVQQVCAYIMKKLGENLYRNLFTAKHDSTDTTKTSKFFNGFCTVIDNDIAGTNEVKKALISSTNENLATIEKITAENAEDVIKGFVWDHAHEVLRDSDCKLFMSDKTYHYYTEDYQANHGSLPYNQAYDKRTLEGKSNIEFVPLSCVPDDFLLLTPKSNILALFNQKTDDETFLVERSLDNHYDVDFIANMFFGTQFYSVSPEVFLVGKTATEEETEEEVEDTV